VKTGLDKGRTQYITE